MKMKVPITREGYEGLREELKRLKREERPKVIQAIAEARAHGDLSENAEYDAAKEKQAFIEGKISEIQGKLSNAQIIEKSDTPPDKVVFGVTVEIADTETDTKKRYTIVGEDESDLKNGKISVQSPVARALIGHKAGDFVTVVTPARQIEYEILDIT
ncbi:MAG: transcription elongation factor GreA [Nitrospirota bacterium]